MSQKLQSRSDILSNNNNMDIIRHHREDSGPRASSMKARGKPKKGATVSKHNAKRSLKQQQGRGSDTASTEDDEDADEEDCCAEADESDEDDEEPNALAPSSDTSLFEGMNECQDNLDDVGTIRKTANVHWTGQFDDGCGVPVTPSKKRTMSQANTGSILSETDRSDTMLADFPRKKSKRRLATNRSPFTTNTGSVGASKSRQSTITETEDDDDDYAAVNFISDSESEEKLERREKKAIAQESDDDNDSDAGSELDLGMDLAGAGGFFDEQMNLLPEDSNLLLYRVASPLPQAPAARKVHFDDTLADLRTSSDSSSDTADIPDLFTTANVNVLTMQNTVGYETFHTPANSDASSYWDFQDEEFGLSAPPSAFAASELGAASIATSALKDEDGGAESGRDLATGETTEEDMPPPLPPSVAPSAVLRSHKPSARRSMSRHSDRPARCLPPLGTWKVNPNKAWATFKKGFGIILHPPKDSPHDLARFWPARSDSSSTPQKSPSTPFQSQPGEDSDLSDLTRGTFSLAPVVDCMLAGLFGGDANATYNFGGQVIGPPEAFYPFTSVNSTGSVHSWEDDDEAFDDDEDSAEEQININDLIKWDGDDDDDEAGMAMASFMDTTAEETDAFEPTSPAGTESSSVMTPFQSHSNSFAGAIEWTGLTTPSYSVNSGVVNSFRSNQDRAKRLSKMPHAPAERATSSHALRAGFAADSFISPARKRKPSRDEQMMRNHGFGLNSGRMEKKKRKSPFKLPPRGFFNS